MAPGTNDDKLFPDRRLADEHDGWLTLDINSDVTDIGFFCWDQLHLFEINSTMPPDEPSDVELHNENVGTIDKESNMMDKQDADKLQYLESSHTPAVLQDLLTILSSKSDPIDIEHNPKEQDLPELSPPSSLPITSLSDSNVETDLNGLSSPTRLPITTVSCTKTVTTGSPGSSDDLFLPDNSNMPLRYKVHYHESSSPLLQPITITVTTDHDYSSADNSDNSNIQNPNNLLFIEQSSPPALTDSKIETITTNCGNSSDELLIYNNSKASDPSIPNKVSHLESSPPPNITIITPSHSDIKTVTTDFSHRVESDTDSTHSSNLLSESSVDDLLSEPSVDDLLNYLSAYSLDNTSVPINTLANYFNLQELIFHDHTNTREPSKGDDNVDTKNTNKKLNSKKSKTDVPPESEQPGPSGTCRFPRTTRPSQDVPEGARGDGRKYRKKPAEKATPSTSQLRRTPIRKSKERSKQLMKLTFDSENDQDQPKSKKRKIDTRCSETNCNSGSNYNCIHKLEAKSKQDKNNEASQRCREKKKQMLWEKEQELIFLQSKNERLKMELAALDEKLNKFLSAFKRNM